MAFDGKLLSGVTGADRRGRSGNHCAGQRRHWGCRRPGCELRAGAPGTARRRAAAGAHHALAVADRRGTAFLRAGRAASRRHRGSRHRGLRLHQQGARRLRVNIDPFFSRIILPRTPRGVPGALPEVSLELIMRDSVGDLVADGFDLALRFGEPPQGSFVARKLVETRVITVASPGLHQGPTSGRCNPKGHRTTRACIDFYDASPCKALRLGDAAQEGGAAAAGQGAPAGVGFWNNSSAA